MRECLPLQHREAGAILCSMRRIHTRRMGIKWESNGDQINVEMGIKQMGIKWESNGDQINGNAHRHQYINEFLILH